MKIKYVIFASLFIQGFLTQAGSLDDFNAKEAALELAKNNLLIHRLMAQKRDIAKNLWKTDKKIKSDKDAMVEALSSDEFKKLSSDEQKTLTDNYGQYEKAEKAYFQALDDNGVALAKDYVQSFDKNITTIMDSPKAYEDAVGLVLARDYLEAEKLEHAEKDYAQKKKTKQSWEDIVAAKQALNAAQFERENSYGKLLKGDSWKDFVRFIDTAQDKEINVKEAFPDYDQAQYFKNMDNLAQQSFDKAKKFETPNTSRIRNWFDRGLYAVTSSMPYIKGRTTDDFTPGKRAGQFANYLRSYKTSWNNWDPFGRKKELLAKNLYWDWAKNELQDALKDNNIDRIKTAKKQLNTL